MQYNTERSLPAQGWQPVTSSQSGPLNSWGRDAEQLKMSPLLPADQTNSAASADNPRNLLKVVLGSVLLAGLLTVAQWSMSHTTSESGGKNWQRHLVSLNQHNSERVSHRLPPELRCIDRAGQVSYSNTIPLGRGDVDSDTTKALAVALVAGDWDAAQMSLVDAQHVRGTPTLGRQLAMTVPQLTPGMANAILSGDSQCYHLYLFDSCSEDGDVVQILIDGQPFATVPITNQGTTLSVPLSRAVTTVGLRGIRDGAGGITVACRTSLGDCFLSVIPEGETQTFGISK